MVQQHNRLHTEVTPGGRNRVAYSLAAGAAVAATASAQGGVVYSGLQEIEIAQFAAQSINLDGDEYQDILLKNYVFFGGNYQGARVQGEPGELVAFTDSYNYANALADGYAVDAATTSTGIFEASLAYGANNPSAEFNSAANAYLGFSFPIGGALPENLHYAWMRVTIDNVAGTFTIHDWAYDDVPGVGILTGDTGPEVLPGDYNRDNRVDALDYAVWRENVGGDNAALNDAGDETDDSANVVDQADFDWWLRNYGASRVAAAAPTQSPEPASLGLLAAGSLGLAALRRRRSERCSTPHAG